MGLVERGGRCRMPDLILTLALPPMTLNAVAEVFVPGDPEK